MSRKPLSIKIPQIQMSPALKEAKERFDAEMERLILDETQKKKSGERKRTVSFSETLVNVVIFTEDTPYISSNIINVTSSLRIFSNDDEYFDVEKNC